MSKIPDDSFKDFLNLLNHIMASENNGDDSKSHVPMMGVCFILGDDFNNYIPTKKSNSKLHSRSVSFSGVPQKKSIPVEVFEGDNIISIQTSLPIGCQDNVSITYQDDVLHLIAGEKPTCSVKIPLPKIDPDRTKKHIKNGVLEIVCFKVLDSSSMPENGA